MPPRRSHKKSRAGCRRCKNRKIKCDEVHPRCGNCSKHGVLCDFENREVLDELATSGTPSTADLSPGASTPVNTFAVPQTPSVHASPGLQAPPTPLFSQPSPYSTSSSAATEVDRFLELRLMHQYTNVTSKTLLTNSPLTDDIWQRAVPQLAFAGHGRTYLADAILSIAALHLRSITPDDKTLVRASHAYSASTLAAYCGSLESGITADNAEALFLTASLIAFQSTASRLFIKDYGDDPNNPSSRYVLPLPWFHAFQGVKTLVATSWQYIRHSTSVQIVIDSQPSFQLDLNPLGPDSFFGHLLDGLDDELAVEHSMLNPGTSHAYAHAVCVLNYAHKNRHAPASLGFPAGVSRRFVELVEEKRPRALAILACFFALLKRMESVWWLDGVSRREVMGLVSLFESGSPWWRHLEWPIRIASWDRGPIPPDVWGSTCDEDTSDGGGLVETMMSHIELMSKMMDPSDELYIAPGDFGLEPAPLD